MRSGYHGGQAAREWRKKIASLAQSRKGDIVRTLKFPLEIEGGAIDFAAARKTYDTTEGIGKGSLTGLLCAIHLSGFRLFSSYKETQVFRDRARYPDAEFQANLSKHFGRTYPKIVPSQIEIALATAPRKNKDVIPPWIASEIARRLQSSWEVEADQTSEISSMIDAAANALAEAFSSWKDMVRQIDKARKITSDTFRQFCPTLPDFGDLPSRSVCKPKSATVAFDPASEFVDMASLPAENWPHRTLAALARRIQAEEELSPTDKNFSSRLQEALTSTSHNGLSWLFNNGLRYLRETSLIDMARDFGMAENEFHRLRQAQDFAQAIPPHEFFKIGKGDASLNYADFRKAIGGKLDSWVKNYWSRLGDLRMKFAHWPQISLTDALRSPENESLFIGSDLKAPELSREIAAIGKRVDKAADAVCILMGEPNVEFEEDAIRIVAEATAFVADIVGEINRLNEQIEKKRAANLDIDDDEVERLQGLKVNLPKEFGEPPKLNRISGGSDDVPAILAKLQRDLRCAISWRREHFRTLVDWAEMQLGRPLDPVAALRSQEARRRKEAGRVSADADIQAARYLAHRLGVLSGRCGNWLQGRIRALLMPLFTKKRDANLYFHNRQGAIYRPLFSRSRHQAYPLDERALLARDWLDTASRLLQEMEARLTAGSVADASEFRDMLQLETFILAERLKALPDSIPCDKARPRLDDADIRIPSFLQALFSSQSGDVPKDDCLRGFNLYATWINGLLFSAQRQGFITRVRFQRAGTSRVYYMAKAKPWQPPRHYGSSEAAIAAALVEPWIKKDNDGKIDPIASLASMKKPDILSKAGIAYLSQAPHDWGIDPMIAATSATPRRQAFAIDTERKGVKSNGNRHVLYRLKSPPSYSMQMMGLLTKPDRKIGDPTFLFTQHWRQSLMLTDGLPTIVAEPERISVEVAIPLIEKRPEPEPAVEFFDRCIGIDLGERRIGYAVYDIRDYLTTGRPRPLVVDGREQSGSVAVPSIRRLMAAVRSHRKRLQPNQKVGQKFSTLLEKFRANVVGDVCNRIDTLCERYGAFPVLESTVGNLESGAQQLELVYKSVVNRYKFSDVAAHETKRSTYWFSALRWQHPYLKRFVDTFDGQDRKSANAKAKTKSKPLFLFPGVAVNPHATSQICNRCNRNPIAGIRDLGNKVKVEVPGEVTIADGMLGLFSGIDEDAERRKAARREKKRLRPNVPIPAKIYDRDDILRSARANLRRPPDSTMSRDTAQSRYRCLYKDCGWQGHADENAAINIGRRFLEKLDRNTGALPEKRERRS